MTAPNDNIRRLPPRLTVVETNDNRPPARSTFAKVSDALESRDCLLVYFGFIGGTFFTLGMAIVWSVL